MISKILKIPSLVLEISRSKWDTHPKVMECNHAKILWDFQIPTDKQVMASQPDKDKKSVVIDLTNDRIKEHYKLEKYQDLR